MPDNYHLLHAKILYESSPGIKGPIEGAYASLAVAGFNPVDQFLIRELVCISLSMINISAINLTMPQNLSLDRIIFGYQSG